MSSGKGLRKSAAVAGDEYVVTPYGRKRRRPIGLKSLRSVLASPFALYRRARGLSPER